LLEGKNVNLKVEERDDIDFEVECWNDLDFRGEYNGIGEQISKSQLMQLYDHPSDVQKVTEPKTFIIQKKDGTRIGLAYHRIYQPYGVMGIGCFLVPSERGKGYGTEATQLLIDYLFLSRDIVRIQATTNVSNKTARRTLEKAGFKTEGTCRKLKLVRGVWNDFYLLSILREEWKEPKILTKTK
jgi:RimJ/RimL family protein N-acetyltransferase